ncbi:MAG: hypothetical protein JO317_00020 [Verrucomicrobiae bacterium]|nr:hypothetical protein [Verrucomicrobiae bacterium]
MYSCAFFSRILAILALAVSALFALPVTLQYFRIRSQIGRDENRLSELGMRQNLLRSLLGDLYQYAQRDAGIHPLLQKHGLAPPPPAPSANAMPAPAPKKK